MFGNQGKPQKPGQKRTPSASQTTNSTSIEGTLKRVLESQESATDAIQAAANALDQGPEVDAPLVQLVNALLIEAIRLGASDVHIEPFETFLRVRLRIDGVLQEVQKVPNRLAPAITSRLKIMADLDICEKRIPQDGCIKFRSGTFEADLRLSTLPSLFGEKIVMRVMSSASVNNDLSKLGIPDAQLSTIREAINRPDGLVLVTGPTGSGKTTTLYAALNELNDISVSVFTAEDPVEGTLLGVTQSQVNAPVGYTFAQILRSLLRQDPDVILVGEIRDQETAEISIKAALTGHLVLSTLHTNCAVSTISRLLNMGIAPYLITSSVGCVVAQRLVRRICTECGYDRPATPELLERLGRLGAELRDVPLKYGKGCKKCNGTGYKGRAPIYEVLSLSDILRQMILQGTSREDLKIAARREGMKTLRESGIALVRTGITTLEEVLGATNEDAPLEQAAPPQSAPQQALACAVPAVPAAVVAAAPSSPVPPPTPVETQVQTVQYAMPQPVCTPAIEGISTPLAQPVAFAAQVEPALASTVPNSVGNVSPVDGSSADAGGDLTSRWKRSK